MWKKSRGIRKKLLETEGDELSKWFWKEKVEKQREMWEQLVLQGKKEKLLIQQINLVQEELTQLENDLKIIQQTQDYVQAR